MGKKVDEHRRALERLDEWEPYLLAHSNLPGPRGNLELAQAAADLMSRERALRLLEWTPERAPVGGREEFLAFCGAVALGRLVAEGEEDLLPRLRELASDPRWRLREAVAVALQRLGAADFRRLLAEARRWARGSFLEMRAAAAALCEPALLRREADARAVLRLLDGITRALARAEDRKSEEFRVLRQGLAYCWSVAVAAAPAEGRAALERWLVSDDPDVRWVMAENLAKKRMLAAGSAWVAAWQKRLRSPRVRAARPRRS